MSNTHLNRDFFEKPTLSVAKNLLGKILLFKNFKGIITETEAYIGMNDEACHASVGRTKRTEVMFGKAGFSYVYLIYGMYHCFNIVTEKEGFPAAVLIRGLKLLDNSKATLDGPGKLCKTLGINKVFNNIDLIYNKQFTVLNSKLKVNFITTPRVGIKKATEKLWRFLVIENSGSAHKV